MTQKELFTRSQSCLIENYGRLPLVMARGEGSYIWDADGTRYIDLFAGFGGCGIAGHCHPAIIEAVEAQVRTLTAPGNLFSNIPQIELAERITATGFGGKVFFCHSGAEADEAALKLVRRAAGPNRYKIICFDNCFHGRTMGGLSLCPESFQEGFEPMLPGAVRLPLGDLDAVENAIDEQTAGIFIEPIQGEGGLRVVPKQFLEGLRTLCDQYSLLLVFDEVWSAPARTGRWYAYQHSGVVPDVMTLAKALGGGLPLAACVASDQWAEVLQPGSHGCTMGGNPLSAAAGVATMKLIEQEDLLTSAQRLETLMKKHLEPLVGTSVEEIRGLGCMFGVRLPEQRAAKEVMNDCREAGVLVAIAKQNVLRFAPPLTTPESLLDEAMEIVSKVLQR